MDNSKFEWKSVCNFGKDGFLYSENVDTISKEEIKINTRNIDLNCFKDFPDFDLIADLSKSVYDDTTRLVDEYYDDQNKTINYIMFEVFKSYGYDSPEKVRILFENHYYNLPRVFKDINRMLADAKVTLCDRILELVPPSKPIVLSDVQFMGLKEKWFDVYGYDDEYARSIGEI